MVTGPCDPPREDFFAAIYRRHGHRCPMSTLGGRLGETGRALVGVQGPLVGIYQTRTCALDGIVVASGCREEEGTLRVLEAGRHCLLLAPAWEEAGVELELTQTALGLAGEHRRREEALETHRPVLDQGEIRRRRLEIAAALEPLLERLRNLPAKTLVDWRPVPAGHLARSLEG